MSSPRHAKQRSSMNVLTNHYKRQARRTSLVGQAAAVQPYGELQVALLLRMLALAAAGCRLPTAHVNDRCTAYSADSAKTSSSTTRGGCTNAA